MAIGRTLLLVTASSPAIKRVRRWRVLNFQQITMPYLAARVPPDWHVFHADEEAEEIDTELAGVAAGAKKKRGEEEPEVPFFEFKVVCIVHRARIVPRRFLSDNTVDRPRGVDWTRVISMSSVYPGGLSFRIYPCLTLCKNIWISLRKSSDCFDSSSEAWRTSLAAPRDSVAAWVTFAMLLETSLVPAEACCTLLDISLVAAVC